MKRQNFSSGGEFEASVGYSRAVKVGNFIFVSGTGPAGEDGSLVGAGDSYLQTKQILKIIEATLKKAGASLKDIVRTRMYVTDINQWEGIGRAHGEVFRDIRPASLLVEVKSLVVPGALVEMEADAIISD